MMETKKTKYDTNPLDPDVVKKTNDVWGHSDSNTQEFGGATGHVNPAEGERVRESVHSEAPTRRYDNPPLDAPYQSIFVPTTHAPPAEVYQPPPGAYQAPDTIKQPGSCAIPGIGLPEKWAVMLPYAPFYIGVVVSLLELFLVPRKEVKVRFHAAQGLSLHIAILIIQTLFSVLSAITGSSVGGNLFGVAAVIFLIVSMVRVGKGEPHRIAPLAEPTQWFNEKIERK